MKSSLGKHDKWNKKSAKKQWKVGRQAMISMTKIYLGCNEKSPEKWWKVARKAIKSSQASNKKLLEKQWKVIWEAIKSSQASYEKSPGK